MNDDCTDEKILAALCKGNNQDFKIALKCLDDNCKPGVVAWLIARKLASQKAEEIFDEAVADAAVNLCFKGKSLTTTLCGYIFSIARNKYREEMQRLAKSPFVEVPDGKLPEPPPETELPKARIPPEIFDACFEDLGEKCRKILNDFFAGYSNPESMERQGYDHPGSFKTIKNRCWTTLVGCIRRKLAQRECFEKLDLPCREIIKDERTGLSWEAIAKKQKLESAASAQAKHEVCKRQWDECVAAKLSNFEKQ